MLYKLQNPLHLHAASDPNIVPTNLRAHRVFLLALRDVLPAAVAHPEAQRQQHRTRALAARHNHRTAPPRQRLPGGPAAGVLVCV